MKKHLYIYSLAILLCASCYKESASDRSTSNKTITELPHIYINTDGGETIVSKDDYLNGWVTITGGEDLYDLTLPTTVKLRGNSTFFMPKKPYKLKLIDDADLFRGAFGDEDDFEETDWVLLANYIDPSLMLNAVAMKAGALVGIDFANNIVPVDLTVNGVFQGSYMLTEQVETKTNRVNLEEGGYLLELDVYMDEEYQFYSEGLQLPVMVKDSRKVDPDEYIDMGNGSELLFDIIQREFNELEATIMTHDNYANICELFDLESAAKFMLIQHLMHNREIEHPKSTFLYRYKKGDTDEKFHMGPIWDFDWTCGYNGYIYFSQSLSISEMSMPLFEILFDYPDFVAIYKNEWSNFKSKEDELFDYIDSYSSLIKESAELNFAIWNIGASHAQSVTGLRTYLKNRIAQLDSEISAM